MLTMNANLSVADAKIILKCNSNQVMDHKIKIFKTDNQGTAQKSIGKKDCTTISEKKSETI